MLNKMLFDLTLISHCLHCFPLVQNEVHKAIRRMPSSLLARVPSYSHSLIFISSSSPLIQSTAVQKHGLEGINLRQTQHSNDLSGHSFGMVEGRSSSSTSSIVSVQPPLSVGSPATTVGGTSALGHSLDNSLETAFSGPSHVDERLFRSTKFGGTIPSSASVCDRLADPSLTDVLSQPSRLSSPQKASRLVMLVFASVIFSSQLDLSVRVFLVVVVRFCS